MSMGVDRLFQILSYSAVFCGFLSLWVSGAFGPAGGLLFGAILVLAWFSEGTRFQISERLGTVLIVAAIPAFYFLWRYRFFDLSGTESALPGVLARLILTLSSVKILQKKSDRDWIFLYVMAFFQVLLAAGITISAVYLATFIAYIFVMVCTIIVFESRKTERWVRESLQPKTEIKEPDHISKLGFWRLQSSSLLIIVSIIFLATPMFFMLPRVGGAGIGGGQGGVSTTSGFSDTVRLGGIGRIQQNDEVVMRVRLEEEEKESSGGRLRWRGIALDIFDNFSWRRSRAAIREVREKGERDVIQVDYLQGREDIQIQTFYLEPLDTPVLFVLPRAVGVQGNFQVLFKDAHDSLTFPRTGERITYKVLSEKEFYEQDVLRADRAFYPREYDNYLQLTHDLDERIYQLAETITADSTNRYDAALAIERYLQNEYGYTLEQKAGGAQPLSDFLFNVREGHCEYFATAMAVMLRTQGIATRIVNGFQQGEYNETADVYVVRQREAHSWVEVYFPGEDAWVSFDPTPFAGQISDGGTTGIVARFNKYLEALEMFWIQYFVAYDNQEQRSLFTSVRRGISDYNQKASSWLGDIQEAITAWWREVRGESGSAASLIAIGYGAGLLGASGLLIITFVWSYRRVVRWKIWHRLWNQFLKPRQTNVVEFYERMIRILSERNMIRNPSQTPLEFAHAVGIPEVITLTDAYHKVRFGEKPLSKSDAEAIEGYLEQLRKSD